MVGLINAGGGTGASDELAEKAPDAFKRASEAGATGTEAEGDETLDDLAGSELAALQEETA